MHKYDAVILLGYEYTVFIIWMKRNVFFAGAVFLWCDDVKQITSDLYEVSLMKLYEWRV